jgi:hypothetical protein
MSTYFVGKNNSTFSFEMDHNRYKYKPRRLWELRSNDAFMLEEKRKHIFPSSKTIKKMALAHLGEASGFEIIGKFSRERHVINCLLLPGTTTLQRMTFLSAIVIATKIIWEE